ncbi:hypothetical protein SAMN04489859_102178 [Paracoccus alcaliphilus]|uniref:N-acetyltransferase domain-containing protein n=1 Tax=Paracoccus alcaliphilus TaxID=34002 RepID=A0A1H8KCT8_9RHOB|nr:hypothetical protein [Paracoccus alcaliphilus]SEN90793.1 hypothetical protein SAMN04489859_102178 [Paracoccus alcaliphilus]
MIRPAADADIPGIIDLIERLVRSVNGPQRVCRVRTGETLAGLIHDPRSVVLMSGRGFIAGTITQTVISPDPVAVELGWYAEDRSGLSLLRAFEAWASDHGTTLVKMSCNGGAAKRILERSGYRVAEIAMVK